MSAFAEQDLYLDTYCDLAEGITVLLGGNTFAGISASSAQFSIRATPLDTLPLVQVPMASGSPGVSFGVAPPFPVGQQCANLSELQAFNEPPVVQTMAPGPVVLTVDTLEALAAASTTDYTVGVYAFVQAGNGAYYAWSPDDTNVPNWSTVVPGQGGNWLLGVTVQITIPQALLAPLVGTSQAQWDLLVTWPNGTTNKLLEGTVFVQQSIGGH